ncbi:PAP2 superfamily protein [Plectosphaerella cucumerina]|uniref:Dolichyldiphosphatase n=1 Tax=Plectosphaerella cucumerina TaxID=40658 RepID=A0A8K0TKU9_9PEZI|nr:PAP2 superfamily protein [Plectosphaerella cucumerina]
MSEDTRPLASLSLTHVYYDPDDLISLGCAWLALLPQALCVVYATLIWSSREAEVALMFLGQLGCEAANFALKRLIKEERPRRIHGKGYGMPSSHAQFVAFWSVFLVLFLFVRHRPPRDPRRDERYRSRALSRAERVVGSVVAVGVAAAVAWSRIYLGYHTERQVVAGCVAGTICAVGWFVATAWLRDVGLLAWALQIPVVKWFRFRDLLLEEDLCQAGWERWEEKRIAAEAVEKKKTR